MKTLPEQSSTEGSSTFSNSLGDPALRDGALLPRSLLYRALALFILLGSLPSLLIIARLLTFTRHLLVKGGPGWILTAQDASLVTQTLASEAFSYVLYTVIILGIMALFIAGSILIQPIRRLEQRVQALRQQTMPVSDEEMVSSEVELLAEPGVFSGSDVQAGNELERLGASVEQMAAELAVLRRNLEKQVAERTQTLERQAGQLQAASEVAQIATTEAVSAVSEALTGEAPSLQKLDALLTKISELISQGFGYYHVGIFLLDEAKEYAVLHASNSEAGRQMLARQHKLNLTDTSIVGYVANHRTARIALNVGEDAVHFRNPYLTETRSEMALPLQTAERLWGVLDVQSTQPDAFGADQQAPAILQMVASQIASAIQNAYLSIEHQTALGELNAALETSRKLSGEMTREAWEKILRGRPDLGYLVKQAQAEVSVTGPWPASMLQSAQAGQLLQPDDRTLLVPVKIREIVAGVIRLRKPDEAQPWSTSEIELMQTLSDQLGVALESARLYDETRRRAERERLTGEITAKMRASNNPQLILQTAASELRKALQASRAQALVQPAPSVGAATTKDVKTPAAAPRVPADNSQPTDDPQTD